MPKKEISKLSDLIPDDRNANKCVVYKITSPSGKIYIGSTVDFKNRIYYYQSMNCKSQRRLYFSFKKYGFENHKVEIVLECDVVDMLTNEAKIGNELQVLGKNGLNCNLPKIGDLYQTKSEETLKKASESMKGKLAGNKNPCYGKKGADHPHFGLKHSKESLLKISKTHKGKKLSDETKLKLSLNRKGIMTGADHFASKKVINRITGDIYNSAKEASNYSGINYKTLISNINERRPNYTNFQYL